MKIKSRDSIFWGKESSICAFRFVLWLFAFWLFLGSFPLITPTQAIAKIALRKANRNSKIFPSARIGAIACPPEDKTRGDPSGVRESAAYLPPVVRTLAVLHFLELSSTLGLPIWFDGIHVKFNLLSSDVVLRA